MGRLSRSEQAGRNRVLVLDAARRVFLARGYHGATLEQIADEAGFSKGVVYSQFTSKADLFLALLEARIAERAAENARAAGALAGGLPAFLDHLARGDQATPGWLLLVIEFRVHAARDPELSGRYAAVHARTVEALAQALESLGAPDGGREEAMIAPRRLAELMLALSTGATLEQAARPDALGGRELAGSLAQVLAPLIQPPARAPAAGSAQP
jgi:AcrR family transcriptional regulator